MASKDNDDIDDDMSITDRSGDYMDVERNFLCGFLPEFSRFLPESFWTLRTMMMTRV